MRMTHLVTAWVAALAVASAAAAQTPAPDLRVLTAASPGTHRP